MEKARPISQELKILMVKYEKMVYEFLQFHLIKGGTMLHISTKLPKVYTKSLAD